VLPNYNTLPDFSQIDAALWTLTQAEALAAAYPQIAAVEPSDVGDPYLFAYLLPPKAEQFLHFIDYWLELRHADGTEDRETDYWIKRLPRESTGPRWCILRDVLGIGRKVDRPER
jgi:hypothetical protein